MGKKKKQGGGRKVRRGLFYGEGFSGKLLHIGAHMDGDTEEAGLWCCALRKTLFHQGEGETHERF